MFDGERDPTAAFEAVSGSIESGGMAPDPDALYHALSERLRRRALYYLVENGRAEIDELGDALAGWHASEGSVADHVDRQRIVTQLHHVHLPKLAQAGLGEYDVDAEIVRPVDLADPVADQVRFAVDYERAYDQVRE